MYIRMEFKEKNILNLGPELLLTMPVTQIAQSLVESKRLYEATWDKELWKNEKQIRIEVRSPMLGHHIYELIGTESELRVVAEALEKHFAAH